MIVPVIPGVSAIPVAEILVDARWQNRVSSIGIDVVVVQGTTVAGRALEPSFLRAKGELLLRTGVAELAVGPIVGARASNVRGKFRQLSVARRRIRRVVDRSWRPTKIRRVDRWPGRAIDLRSVRGLEVQGQILDVDRTQLAIPPSCILKLAALRLVDGGGRWLRARKGRVVRQRRPARRLMPVRGGGGVMVNRGGLLLEDRRCSRESAGREGGSRWLVVEGGVRRVFGRPLGATTGFVIGRPHDTWRDHRAFFRPDRFWKRARVRRSISAFLRRIFFLFFFLRSATKRRRRATRSSSSLLLLLLLLFPLLARDEIKLWPDFASPSSPRAPSFSFLSLATPPSLHAFFFYRR